MRFFFDTEFIEDGRTIDLLSIGIVAEDGRELYLENANADFRQADPWVRENVFTSMLWTPAVQRDGLEIQHEVRLFCDPEEYGKPEFWAYYADYDWVVLCQLFGRMVDLPKGWPKFCLDFKQRLVEHGDLPIQKPSDEHAHNALEDARWLKSAFERTERLISDMLRAGA